MSRNSGGFEATVQEELDRGLTPTPEWRTVESGGPSSTDKADV